MKSRTRKGLGLVLLVGSALTATVLYLVGVPLLAVDAQALPGSPSGSGLVTHLSFHWLFFVLAFAFLVGLWFLLSSKHETPSA